MKLLSSFFDGYDADDVAGLLKNCLEKGRDAEVPKILHCQNFH